jgi:GMP synthase (glutamine-hydrolysing)
VLLTHGDSVDQVPEGFRVIARSGDLIAGIECAERQLYGVQFHPEVRVLLG